MRARYHETSSLEEHHALIQEQVDRSMADPETRTLAASLVSSAFDSGLDPRSGDSVPVVRYHGRLYRGALSWHEAGKLCGARDHACEVTAVWNFVVLNVRYTADPTGMDMYQDLRTILESGSADCDDMVVVFSSLLQAVGYDTKARVISVSGDKWEHIYPVIKVPKIGWLPLDVTEPNKQPGWEFPNAAAVKDFKL